MSENDLEIKATSETKNHFKRQNNFREIKKFGQSQPQKNTSNSKNEN